MNPVALIVLEPHFLRYEDVREIVHYNYGDKEEDREHMILLPSFEKAEGIHFLCPLCGNHRVICSFADRNLKPHQGTHNKKGEPVRWKVTGNTFENLSLSPSILLESGCNWHGFIINGQVT